MQNSSFYTINDTLAVPIKRYCLASLIREVLHCSSRLPCRTSLMTLKALPLFLQHLEAHVLTWKLLLEVYQQSQLVDCISRDVYYLITVQLQDTASFGFLYQWYRFKDVKINFQLFSRYEPNELTKKDACTPEKVWFSHLKAFNVPFDGRVYVIVHCTSLDIQFLAMLERISVPIFVCMRRRVTPYYSNFTFICL